MPPQSSSGPSEQQLPQQQAQPPPTPPAEAAAAAAAAKQPTPQSAAGQAAADQRAQKVLTEADLLPYLLRLLRSPVLRKSSVPVDMDKAAADAAAKKVVLLTPLYPACPCSTH